MTTTALRTVLHRLHRSVRRQDEAARADGELLESFTSRRDEAAFEALLRRHAPMVLGVCRRVLGNEADAEDAFQATFLVLVRKAATIRPRGLVGNWLYGVAHTTALKARAMRTKRTAKEREAAARPKPEVGAETWHQLQTLLDQELKALPDKYRAAIVLCDLEGQPIKEAARQFGCPAGTIGARLTRGRRLLAKRLARHGVVVSAGTLAVVLSQTVASAGVPTSLVSSTIQAATLLAADRAAAAGVIPAKVAALIEGVMKAVVLTKLKIATVVLLVVAATGIGAGALIYHTQASEPATARQGPAPKTQFPPPRPDASEPPDKGREARPTAQDQPQQQGEKAVKKELESLQGTWYLVGGETKGIESPEEDLMVVLQRNQWQKLVISSDKFTWGSVIDEEAMKGTVKIDPVKDDTKPRRMDMVFERDGKTVTAQCIYELVGDRLKLCYGERTRPKEFKTTPDSDPPRMYIWKREKK